MIREFLLAISFLTRIPVPKRMEFKGLTLSYAAWAFPLIGIIVGAVGAGVYTMGLYAGLTQDISAWVTVGALVLLTGGLHEDGLGDMADGLAHGRDKLQRLAIMKDSRIGAYGVLALVISVGIRADAIASFSGGYEILYVMIAAAALSRSAMVLLMHGMTNAKDTGLAAQAEKPAALQVVVALLLAGATLAPFEQPKVIACAVAAPLLACLFVGLKAKKNFGGVTGDVLGATQQVSEIFLLLVFSALH